MVLKRSLLPVRAFRKDIISRRCHPSPKLNILFYAGYHCTCILITHSLGRTAVTLWLWPIRGKKHYVLYYICIAVVCGFFCSGPSSLVY